MINIRGSRQMFSQENSFNIEFFSLNQPSVGSIKVGQHLAEGISLKLWAKQ
jgi:hypothetical protein